MVFSSLLFLFRFLPIVLILYFVAPKKWRNLLLFLSSLVFYAWGEPVYVVLMIFSTVVDFIHGKLVHKYLEQGERKKAKGAVISSMIINLALLGFFKYGDFLLMNINSILGTSIPYMELSLPIGISFYTFQTMSYTIDVYRGEAKVQHNIISFGAYVALFPQLIAGPIVQYKTIAEQLDHRQENELEFANGVVRFMTGLGKKVLLANNIGLLWNQISSMSLGNLPILTAWIGACAFAFQIYFDFSGYSDMAIGLGRMFGFRFLENFNYPYCSKSITEFWRRWHISLGTWFREYVYIPLGGNRCSPSKQICNITIVWLLTGLWHGASWNFVLWGAYFGVLLVIEKKFLLKYLQKCPVIIQHIYTIVIVLISWILFAFDQMSQVVEYLKSMFGASGVWMNRETMYIISNYGLLFLLLVIACTSLPNLLAKKLKEKMDKQSSTVSTGYTIVENVILLGIFILSVAYLVDSSYNPFLYFRF